MATNTMTSPLTLTSHIVPNGDISITNGYRHTEDAQDEGDDRSSSLSELGERTGHEEPDTAIFDGSDINDTEAETERLEESPQKIRRQQNVLLTPTNDVYQDHQSPLASPTLPVLHQELVSHSIVEKLEPSSDFSSLEDSGEEDGKSLANGLSSPRKRKRLSFDQDSLSDQDVLTAPSTKAARVSGNASASALDKPQSASDCAEEDDQTAVIGTFPLLPTEPQSRQSPEPVSSKEKHQKGQRMGIMARGGDFEITHNADLAIENLTTPRQRAPSSNDEEVDNDEAGDIPEVDNVAKTQEGVIQKKVALNSLNALEKCFATLRDKLFDERLAQCNEELAMLESTIPTHPELVAQKDVIDQRRDQKLHHDRTLMKYKMQSIQRESIANKAQVHSQYMQAVRNIRVESLEELNKESYQLQKQRRSIDSDVPEYMFTYNPKRSQQIIQQTAYNTEVSLLSGIAKHIGFPAAPDISKARPQQIKDDLRDMEISTQAPPALHSHPPILRAASSFTQQRPRPDGHFFEQNPWADPQHPSHHQPRQQMHRQISALSRAATPTSTPAAQRRFVDLTEPQDSASTVPDHPSGPNSSTAIAPGTGEASKSGPPSHFNPGGIVDSTPSRVIEICAQATTTSPASFEPIADAGKASQATKAEKHQSPSLSRGQSQDIQTPSSLAKPLPFSHTSGSYSSHTPRTSTPGRYTRIKAEEIARHSPVPRYHTPPIATVGNGQMNRFAA